MIAAALTELNNAIQTAAASLHAVAQAIDERPHHLRDYPPMYSPEVQRRWKAYLIAVNQARKLVGAAEAWLPDLSAKRFPNQGWIEALYTTLRFGLSIGPNKLSGEELTAIASRMQVACGDLARLQAYTAAAVVAADPPQYVTLSDAVLPEKQRAILAALNGLALTAKQLAKEVNGHAKDTSHFQQDHIKPLMDLGRIKNKRSVGGYYRPDAPPTMA